MDQPNIVFIVLDAVRSDHLSCYGHDRATTPNIDAIAENAIQYTNAFANTNWTGTSHSTIFTGRLPSNSGIHGENQKLPKKEQTLFEAVREAGYRTFAMSAGTHIRSNRGYSRGVDKFKETYQVSLNQNFIGKLVTDAPRRQQSIFSAASGSDDKTLYKFESMKRWITDGDQPYFAFVNAKTAHHPYNPPRPHKSRFCPDLNRPRFQFIEELFGDEFGERQSLPGTNFERLQRLSYQYPVISGEMQPTDEEWDIIRSWYDGAIHYLDRRIGELVDWLRETGQFEETCLIITADHGEYFGEKGLEKHYYGLYEPVLRVPLLIQPPDENEASEIRSMVSLADLYPTIIELAADRTPDRPHARSLVPFKEGPHHDHIFAELGAINPVSIQRHHPEFDGEGYGAPTQVVRDDSHKLVTRADGSVELYDWRSDPDESTDLSTKNTEIVNRLQQVIDEQLGALSEEAPPSDVEDDQLREHLKKLGYL